MYVHIQYYTILPYNLLYTYLYRFLGIYVGTQHEEHDQVNRHLYYNIIKQLIDKGVDICVTCLNINSVFSNKI